VNVGRLLALGLTLAVLPVPRAAGAEPACDLYAERLVDTGRTARALSELSGLVASVRHRGIYWAHNDSGHDLTLYAIRDSGGIAATFPLGIAATDPEDIGLGPCERNARRTCLYLADTGDNLRSRSRVQVIRVVEPDALHSGRLVAEAFPFTYPDGSHDAEALLVDPRTAEVFVVTKSIMSLGHAYRVPIERTARPARAVALGPIATATGFDALVTAASVHPSGTRVLLRTYRGVWEFQRPGAHGLAEVLRSTPRPVPGGGSHLQGEAIAYTSDGTGYLLAGEGEGTTLLRAGCARP
jgi:hypothetical protein